MTMIRWNFVRDIDLLRQDLDRAFQQANVNTRRFASAPALQVWETPSAYLVKLLAPGVDTETLSIEATPSELTVSGRLAYQAPEGASLQHAEFGDSEFSRTLRLPTQVKTEAVTADYSDGILAITLPKVATARAVKVALGGAKSPELASAAPVGD